MSNTEDKQKTIKAKEFLGEVISLKNPKTAIVSVMHITRHPIYKKATQRHKRFAVHLDGVECKVGDKVKIQETRPISKTKHFKLIEIVKL
jgi:small subunit ribosomal protein S17